MTDGGRRGGTIFGPGAAWIAPGGCTWWAAGAWLVRGTWRRRPARLLRPPRSGQPSCSTSTRPPWPSPAPVRHACSTVCRFNEARREAPGSRTRYRMPHHKQLRSTLRALDVELLHHKGMIHP